MEAKISYFIYLKIRYFLTFTFGERRRRREFGSGAISIPMKFCTLDSGEIGHAWHIEEERRKRERERGGEGARAPVTTRPIPFRSRSS